MDYLKVINSKIVSVDMLRKQIELWHMQSKKVVFTNGCFDILHYGHVNYLAQARSLGHALVVGLNSDVSVKLLNKGASRPLQDQQSRAFILASLHVVDNVILFDEETPAELISQLLPDILVKGSDYSDVTKIAGYKAVTENGGVVATVDFVEGYSTTLIEKKIISGK